MPEPLTGHAIQLSWRNLLVGWRTAPDHRDQQVLVNHRRAADTEEVLHDTELLRRVAAPDPRPVDRMHTVQLPFRAVEVHSCAIHHRAAARPPQVPVQVGVMRRIAVFPKQPSRFALQTQQSRLSGGVVALEVAPAAHRAQAVAFAQRPRPDESRAVAGPVRCQTRLGRFAVPRGAQEGRPVRPAMAGAQVGHDRRRRHIARPGLPAEP